MLPFHYFIFRHMLKRIAGKEKIKTSGLQGAA
jgi:hypothetical protein